MNEFPDNYFELIDCPLCNGKNHSLYLEIRYGDLRKKDNLDYILLGINKRTKFYVKRCQSCGLVFVNPRLKLNYESLVYNESKKTMYKNDAGNGKTHRVIKDRKIRIEYLSPLLQTFAYVDLQKSNLKLFDFGCGYGYSMGLARELGLDTYGVDIDKERLAICEEKELNVSHPSVFDSNYPGIKADIILWMNNIEHLIDLNGPASYIKGKCKRGTILYVNGLTPKIINIERKRGEFVKAHFVEHINYFPIETLDLFLSMHGFKPIIKPYMSVVRSLRDLLKCAISYIAGRTLGYNPFTGAFARLYRYSSGGKGE